MSALYELDFHPNEIVSAVRFSPDSQVLAVSSWDGSVYFHRRPPANAIAADTCPLQPAINLAIGSPILDICFAPRELLVVGLSGAVQSIALTEEWLPDEQKSPQQWVNTLHGLASNKVAYSHEHQIAISTSWDGTMHVQELPGTGRYIAIRLAAQPFSLCISSGRAVVAMAERRVSVYDLAALRALLEEEKVNPPPDPADISDSTKRHILEHIEPWQSRESSLKFMTRAVACTLDGAAYVCSSIEGRVGVEWFDPAEQSKTYAFKCHRQVDTVKDDDGQELDVDVVYPVNALAFHPVHGTFATGGGDGAVLLWNAFSKRRVRDYPRLEASVLSLDFSNDGDFLAIGISSGLEDGDTDYQAPADLSRVKVYIRTMPGDEAKGKPVKSKG